MFSFPKVKKFKFTTQSYDCLTLVKKDNFLNKNCFNVYIDTAYIIIYCKQYGAPYSIRCDFAFVSKFFLKF